MKEKIKRLSKEERRAQILEAAQMIFIRNGYNGSTTMEIAKAAEISEVTLFRYFSSKQEIFLEVIDPILFQSLEKSIVFVKGECLETKLEYVLFERIRMISKNNEILKLILKEESLLAKLGKEDFINRFRQLFKDLLLENHFPIKNIEFTLRILMGSILTFLYMPEHQEETIHNFINQVVYRVIVHLKEGENQNEKGI
jgi:AcrR family transcriptional regulator